MEIAKNVVAWIKELESGKYSKTICTLEREGRYCCLGVAAKMIKPNQEAWITNYGPVKKFLGLRSDFGEFEKTVGIDGHYIYSLALMNDVLFDRDINFENVAKFIRDNIDNIWEPALAKEIKDEMVS